MQRKFLPNCSVINAPIEACSYLQETKLDIFNNTGGYTRLYGQAPKNGGNIPIDIRISPSVVGEGIVPWRTTGGNIVVPTDENVLLPHCAVPKSYVDDKIQALIDKLTSTAGGEY